MFVKFGYFSTLLALIVATKPNHSGQRIFTDVQCIDFIDPSKHGFHIVLREEFVNTHLQLVHAPTVYASAIAPQSSIGDSTISQMTNRSFPQKSIPATDSVGNLRTSKTLYPENGNPDDGLLDGRTIKISGLRERTWYYVCVEFESNLRRHELVTGMSCQLKRTLDKFGQSVESTITEYELLETTDRSISVRLTVNTDFPLFLHVYLNGHDSNSVTQPTQTFFVRPQVASQKLRLYFGPYLQPETVYGQMCIVEEPWAQTYTSMGRALRLSNENCYFKDLKTKSASKLASQKKMHQDSPSSPQAQIRIHGHVKNMHSNAIDRFSGLRYSVICVISIHALIDFRFRI